MEKNNEINGNSIIYPQFFDNIPIKRVKDLLISVEHLLLDIKNEVVKLDGPTIFARYAEALETLFHEKISNCFKMYLDERYGKNFIPNKDIRIKFGNLQENKLIPLRLWEIIIKDFEEAEINEDLLPFKKCMDKFIDTTLNDLIKDACRIILSISPAKITNGKKLKLEDFISVKEKYIPIFEQLLDLLYKN